MPHVFILRVLIKILGCRARAAFGASFGRPRGGGDAERHDQGQNGCQYFFIVTLPIEIYISADPIVLIKSLLERNATTSLHCVLIKSLLKRNATTSLRIL